ncbi:hypothetical protein [Glycomyces arizonensis]|uniref:hypothetical protein n=1 Tax=Glycomyces arizonensis TaxID=256035 RepID=UPI00041EA8E9|nr:hypothetical protein [Glycomyces arizonensis]
MHDDSHIVESLRNARPELVPPVEFDVDRIMADGRRLRRRNRLALGGASAAGVVAAVSAIALVLTMSPESAPVDTADPAPQTTAAEEEEAPAVDPTDAAMAGYPWTEAWSYGSPGGLDLDLKAATAAAFAGLLVEGGLWDESAIPEPTAECDLLSGDPAMTGEGCDFGDVDFLLNAEQRPGNYGQVFLREYHAEVWGDQYAIEHPVFNMDLYLPGGWTAEPGPVTGQVFPQHLISRAAYYTDEAPVFESTTLDDGRTVSTADHGCAYDVLIAYPTGTALRLSWEIGCEPGTEGMYPVELESLVDAALTMPELDYESPELQPVDELWDIPTGWLWDPSWESEAAGDAAAAGEAALAVLDERYPGATVGSATPTQNGVEYRGATHLRVYRFSGTLPMTTDIDGEVFPVGYEMHYFLPGGWLPGLGDGYVGEPYLAVCRDDEGAEGATCNRFERDGRTVVTEQEEGLDGNYSVTVHHPDGWAASIWIESAADAGLTMDEIVDLVLALPAPPYDAEAVPEVPTE